MLSTAELFYLQQQGHLHLSLAHLHLGQVHLLFEQVQGVFAHFGHFLSAIKNPFLKQLKTVTATLILFLAAWTYGLQALQKKAKLVMWLTTFAILKN